MKKLIDSSVRFGWFWYNDQEILFDREVDMERKVKAYADQGVTILILCSCTHFRWSFKPWWSKITECIAMIVRCAHKYGLKVMEHHSSLLTHFPADETKMNGFNRLFIDRKGAVEHWDGFIDHLMAQKEKDYYQLDPDGKPVFTPYDGYALCINNDAFMKEYLAYLATIYAVGVDGMRTDDIAFYGEGCFCESCKAKFKAEYGVDMPTGAMWREISQNIAHPLVQKLLRFRARSLINFHRRVTEHYNSLGIRPMRPNYISGALTGGGIGAYVE